MRLLLPVDVGSGRGKVIWSEDTEGELAAEDAEGEIAAEKGRKDQILANTENR